MKTTKTLRWLVLFANLVMLTFIVSVFTFSEVICNEEFLTGFFCFLIGCFCLHALALAVGVLLLIPKRCRSHGRNLLAWLMKPSHTFGGETLGHDFWKWISGPGIFSAYNGLYGASLLLCFIAIINTGTYYTPAGTNYHTADDLYRVTGVKFPEITPVDSLSCGSSFTADATIVKFVPRQPLKRNFFRRLDKACREDSCCWNKDGKGYYYDIYPKYNLDRRENPKAEHIRKVEDVNGNMVDDWDGTYISVYVPIKGDTITVTDGWTR